MSAANSRAHAISAASSTESLFKEDRPRRIDRVISFFGDDDDVCGERLLDSFDDAWSER